MEAEKAVDGFAERNPEVTVTVLRFSNALGPGLRTSHTELFAHPAVPCILGFDPRYQFIHEEDLVGVLHFAVERDLPGVYNAAADGVLALSEVASLLGRPLAPILPPWGTSLADQRRCARLASGCRRRCATSCAYGRGLDNRKLKGAGYAFGFTTRETVLKHAEAMRVRSLRRDEGEPYRYEREVEEFLRWSPSVRRRGTV